MVELTMADLAAAMRAAVRGLVDRLDTEQRRQLVLPFDGDMHKRWTYLPGQRPGLRLGDLSDEQLEPALDLLQLVHSVRGWSDTQLVIRIEAVRRELSLQQAGRAGVDPYQDLPYWLVVLGDRRAPIPGPGGSTATTCWRRPWWSGIRSTGMAIHNPQQKIRRPTTRRNPRVRSCDRGKSRRGGADAPVTG
jgi:Protein of unknown function (DUF3500)